MNVSLQENLHKNKETEEHIEELTKQLEAEREKEQLANEKASELKMKLSSLEQSNQFLLENIRRVKREIEKLYEDESTFKSDMEKSKGH